MLKGQKTFVVVRNVRSTSLELIVQVDSHLFKSALRAVYFCFERIDYTIESFYYRNQTKMCRLSEQEL